jgi:hypothetical protein
VAVGSMFGDVGLLKRSLIYKRYTNYFMAWGEVEVVF